MPHHSSAASRLRAGPLLALLLVALAVIACAGGPTSSTPGSSAPPGGSPTPARATTPEEAVARVVAFEPRFAGIAALDPDLIGQSAWYTAEPAADGGFDVEITLGWGDCQAGCIDRHTWTFAVAEDGSVELVAEEGPPVPAAEWPSPAGSGRTGIFGIALAGPVCPVEQPGEVGCEPRPVDGASIVVVDAAGTEVASAVTDGAGTFFVEVPAGEYQVIAQPVEGLMGNPSPIPVSVTTGEATVELPYDTGIR